MLGWLVLYGAGPDSTDISKEVSKNGIITLVHACWSNSILLVFFKIRVVCIESPRKHGTAFSLQVRIPLLGLL